jgi:hypothetical protein
MSKPINIVSIEIAAAGGASGSGTTYDTNNSEETTIEFESEDLTVENGQTLINLFNANFNALMYDLDVLSDSNVQTSATDVGEAKIFLNGATGSDTYSMDNVRISAYPDYSTGRKGARVRATQKGASDPITAS